MYTSLFGADAKWKIFSRSKELLFANCDEKVIVCLRRKNSHFFKLFLDLGFSRKMEDFIAHYHKCHKFTSHLFWWMYLWLDVKMRDQWISIKYAVLEEFYASHILGIFRHWYHCLVYILIWFVFQIIKFPNTISF